MKVLGILGAHSQTGITAQMLQTVMDNVDDGVVTETIFLEDYNIHPASVKQNNDLDLLVDKLSASDVWVFATPTYWRNISGVMKHFLDCLRPKLVYFKSNGDTIPANFKNKHYLSLTNCYTSTFENFVSGVTDDTFKTIDRVMAAAGVIKVGEIVCPSTHNLKQLPAKKAKLCAHYGQKLSQKTRKDDSTVKRYIQLFVMVSVMALVTMLLQQLLKIVVPLSNFWWNYISFTLIFFVLLSSILHFMTNIKHRRR